MTSITAPLPIDNRAGRHLLLWSQGLAEPPRRAMDARDCLALIERLGFVQLDSVVTLERAHHMILSARCHGYRRPQLTRLHERDVTLFENWTHDASLIPTRFFPYWHRKFADERQRMTTSRWWADRSADFEAAVIRVRERLTAEGRLMSRHFDGERETPSGGWWDWTPSKMALEFLWRTGEAAIAGRDGFQKIYDLTERVIPEVHRTQMPDPAAVVDWACRSALDRLGAATAGEIAGFWDLVTIAEVKAWIAAQGRDTIVPVTVEGADGKRTAAYAPADIEVRLAALPEPPAGLRILSPFDPVIRDRRRLLRLFGFDYRFEAFTPAEKRLYGYYVFPLLEGDRFVGRVDAKGLRAEGAVVLSGLWWEAGVRRSRGRMDALQRELARIGRFIGIERVEDRRPDAVVATPG
jgi:uncharacterized protein YcaQ